MVHESVGVGGQVQRVGAANHRAGLRLARGAGVARVGRLSRFALGPVTLPGLSTP